MIQHNDLINDPLGRSIKLPGLLAILSMILSALVFLSACTPSATTVPTPTPTPTATRRLVRPNNQNVETLNAVQAVFGEFKYGFAPLLQLDETRLVIESGADGEVVRLAYPQQPADPAQWPTMDSFILANAVRNSLLEYPQTRRVTLGKLKVTAPVDDLEDDVSHYAVWVRFSDGSSAVVDLTPLATNFAARHIATEYLTDAIDIESQFAEWRKGVLLNNLQPMTVVSPVEEVYYLLAKVLVFPDRYEFVLGAHVTQTATPIRPLLLTRGAMVKMEVKRIDFESVQELVIGEGPDIFIRNPGLLSRKGDDDPALVAVLDDHLPLLWHMVTKLEHKKPRPGEVPLATATLTPTPIPTPTPTPTPTPKKPELPLSTS